jgi:hypothetical protein
VGIAHHEAAVGNAHPTVLHAITRISAAMKEIPAIIIPL